MAKAKDINIYKIFSKTYNNRPMFGFMGYGELKLMKKVDKPIRQTDIKVSMGTHVDSFIKEKKYNTLLKVVK